MSENPLRILTLANVPPDPNSGAAGTVYHTNVALRELGHQVDEIWEDQLGPRRVKHGNLHSLIEQPRLYRREVLKAVSQNEYDVVMMSQPQAYLAAKALKKAKFAGIVLNRSHGVELRADAALSEWYRKLNVRESRIPMLTGMLRKLLKRQWSQIPQHCDGIVVPSEMDRQCLLKDVAASPHQVRTIHHGVLEAFQSATTSAQRTGRHKCLLYVGQNSFIKGPKILIQILNDAMTEDEQLTMTWVTSESAHAEIREQLQEDIQSRVTLLDWMPQEELLEIYDSHGVFLFPSFMEGAGKASLEAMSRGLCVVASHTGAMCDYIEHGNNGFLAQVGEVAEFVASVKEVTKDEAKSQKISDAARKYALSKTWKLCAQGIADFATELKAEKSGQRVVAGVTSESQSVSSSYDHWHSHRANSEQEEASEPRMATWHQMVLPRLGDLSGLRVAEIGCGRGDFSIYLAQQGAQVTGIDFSSQAIEVAKERSSKMDTDVDFRVGDAMQIDLPENEFDLVISCECMEHVLEPQRMSNELFRICKPNGRLLLTTPSYFNGQLVAWGHSWLTGRSYNSGSGVQPHENFFFWFTVKPMFRKSGFKLLGTDSRIYQFLLLPKVAPQRLRVDEFRSGFLNRLFRPIGLHYFYELRKPKSLETVTSQPLNKLEGVSTS